MSGKLRPPNRIDALSFPIFGLDWYAQQHGRDDGGGTPATSSWLAFCGGGGSAKTGVRNNILVIHNNDLPLQISTGDQAGSSVRIYQDAGTGTAVYMLVTVGPRVQRYALHPTGGCVLTGECVVGETCEHLAVSPQADQFAVGVGDEGNFKVFAMKGENFETQLLYTMTSHSKGLTSLAYSAQGDLLISAARDGTAIIWKDGKIFSGLRCSIPEPNGGTRGRPQQVLVRGCAFADFKGNLAVTVHSGRKSDAYVSIWKRNEENTFKCLEKTLCSELPATTMSISMDKRILAIGLVDGSVILWDKVEWKPIKKFVGVHGLPVTCVAARPLPVPFVNEEFPVHIRTGSLDCNTGVLTLSTKAPRKPAPLNGGGCGFCSWFFFLIYWALTLSLLYMGLSSMFPNAQAVCTAVYEQQGLVGAAQCVFENVIWTSPQQLRVPLPPI